MVTWLVVTTSIGGESRKPDARFSYAPLLVGREGKSFGTRAAMILDSGGPLP